MSVSSRLGDEEHPCGSRADPDPPLPPQENLHHRCPQPLSEWWKQRPHRSGAHTAGPSALLTRTLMGLRVHARSRLFWTCFLLFKLVWTGLFIQLLRIKSLSSHHKIHSSEHKNFFQCLSLFFDSITHFTILTFNVASDRFRKTKAWSLWWKPQTSFINLMS